MTVVNLFIPTGTAEQSVSEYVSLGQFFAGLLQYSGGCWGKGSVMKANVTTCSLREFI